MKIIAYRDRAWFAYTHSDPEFEEGHTDWSQWDTLCRAYEVPYQLIDLWPEAEVPEGSKVYALTGDGDVALHEHTVDPDGVYVIGRSQHHLPTELTHYGQEYEATIRIVYPRSDVPIYGISVGSILLARMSWQ